MLSLMMFLAVPQEATQATCSATPAEALVGERYRRGVPTRARKLSGSRTVRVIYPGQIVTQDFREDRLNLRLDYRRRITSVRCG